MFRYCEVWQFTLARAVSVDMLVKLGKARARDFSRQAALLALQKSLCSETTGYTDLLIIMKFCLRTGMGYPAVDLVAPHLEQDIGALRRWQDLEPRSGRSSKRGRLCNCCHFNWFHFKPQVEANKKT